VIINVVAAENLTLPFKNRMKDVHLKFAVFHVSHSFKQNAFPHFHYYFNHIVYFVFLKSPPFNLVTFKPDGNCTHAGPTAILMDWLAEKLKFT
jgi:hypothetical protein